MRVWVNYHNIYIKEEIYYSQVCRGLLPEEQGKRRTNELRYIDHYILKEAKTRRKNVAMAQIDYKKALDITPQT